jgi:hypothetical protein
VKTFSLILMIVAAALALAIGCAGLTVHQQVSVACSSAASSLDTLVLAKQAGNITAAQLNEANGIYEKSVVPTCNPVADSFSDAFKAAVADLAARAGGVP